MFISKVLIIITLLLIQTNIVTAENYDRADSRGMIDKIPYLISPPEHDCR